MRIVATDLDGACVIHHAPHSDERGWFSRLFCSETFGQAGLEQFFPQTSISFNTHPRTLRGLHFQREPQAEVKLVTCVSGRIFDVIVDVRRGSATYGKSFSIELSQNPITSLYIPKGFAHGFMTIEPDTAIIYHISASYAPQLASGIRWDDPSLAISWPFAPELVSDSDVHLPLLEDCADH